MNTPEIVIRELKKKREGRFTHSVKCPALVRLVYVCSRADALALANANRTYKGRECTVLERGGSSHDEAERLASLARIMRFSGELACSLGVDGKRFPVASLREASDKFRAVTEHFASSEMPANCVIWCDGKQVATVSYNGRVWDMEGEEIQVDPSRRTCKQLDKEGWSSAPR